MNKPVFYIVFILCAVFSMKAQENLVPNGSFEDFNDCPTGIGDFSVKNWYSPTFQSPDYFNTCNTLLVPNNFIGYQYPQNGNAYVGFGIVVDSLYSSREYIQVELISSLQLGKSYYFSCYLSKAELSPMCITELGITFSENIIGGQTIDVIIYPTQFTNSIKNVTCDESNWIKIEFIFTADGNEKFLTIGYFSEDIALNKYVVNNLGENFAYYYVDDVILKEVIIPNVFTPNNDNINDVLIVNVLENFSLTILNRWGNVVFQTEKAHVEFWDGKCHGKDCANGVYFYFLINEKNNIKKTGSIHLIR